MKVMKNQLPKLFGRLGKSWKPAEDARVVTTDVEDLVALQIEVAVQSFDHHLRRSDQDAERLGKYGDC